MSEQRRRFEGLRVMSCRAIGECERQRTGLLQNEWWEARLRGRGPLERRYFDANGFFRCLGCGAERRAAEVVRAKSWSGEIVEVCGYCEALAVTHWVPIEPPWDWRPVMSGVIPCRRAA